MEKGEETSDETGWLAMQVRGKALAVRDGRSWGAVGQASRAHLHCNAIGKMQTQIQIKILIQIQTQI